MNREQLLGIIVHEYHYQKIKHIVYKWIEWISIFIVVVSFLVFDYCCYTLCNTSIPVFIGSASLAVITCLYINTATPGTISRRAKRRLDTIIDEYRIMPLMSNRELSLFSSEYTSWAFDERGFIDGAIDDAATLMLHSLTGKDPATMPRITLKQRVLSIVMRPYLRQTAA
ncbi:hypothetical protein [Enterobacter ludwigii]|uniref:hypothetical protein n=1 Tax=Enterobacter ludwigii TaxID=299767 RepID=UPI003F71836E